MSMYTDMFTYDNDDDDDIDASYVECFIDADFAHANMASIVDDIDDECDNDDNVVAFIERIERVIANDGTMSAMAYVEHMMTLNA